MQRARLFDDVLCGVDGTRGSYEAVRQAAVLAGPGARLTLLAVAALTGSGQHRVAAIDPQRARRALAYARRIALTAGVEHVVTEIDESAPVVETLLDRAREHGVLVIGAPFMPRIAHLLVGGTATRAAHLLPTPLLVARRPPAHVVFADCMIVASDGSQRCDGLVDFAIEFAREHRSTLALVHAADCAEEQGAIAAQHARLTGALGDRGSLHVEDARPLGLLLRVAEAQGCSLIIVASRHLTGVRSLSSLSERLVHQARCSVLVMRAEDVGDSSRMD
jgi:nucleotide-binding universal stress UspA family protein